MKILSRFKSVAITASIITCSSVSVANPYLQIDDYVNKNKEIIRLNSGTAVAVIKGHEIVYEGYFGHADLQNQIPVDHNTAFYIASMTKPFTALLTLLQQHQGKLNTNQTVADMFPDIKFKRAIQADKVTVRDLLAHTSGIDNWPLIQATAYTGLHDKDTIDKLLTNSYVNENAPFGEYDYTNVGYNILSHWMDNNMESDWQGQLESHIFKPLGMHMTSARISDAEKHGWTLAKGYSVKSPEPTAPVYLTKTDNSMHAAGGMISTARDLAQFLIMQVNQGKVANQQILPESVVLESQQKVASYERNGSKRHYGWGWFVRNLFDHTLLEHRGGYPGASTYMSFMPEQKLGLIVLSNQDRWGGDLAYALEDIAYAIALGKDKQAVTALATKYQNHAIEKATEHYAQKSNIKPTLASDLKGQFIGTYVHDTLGKIIVEEAEDKTVQLSWGNLKSTLNQGADDDKLSVEFIPNSHSDILFLVGTDKQQRLQYRDYVFNKQVVF